jgi:hypothetical protein
LRPENGESDSIANTEKEILKTKEVTASVGRNEHRELRRME